MRDYPLSLPALQAFTELVLGFIHVLLATGLSLIFGLLIAINFAHGAFFMVGAHAELFLYGVTGQFWACLVGVPLLVGLGGLAVERVLVRPLYGRGIDDPLLLTFGLSYVMIELVRLLAGKQSLPFDAPEALGGAIDIGVGYFPLHRLFVIGAAAVVLLALWLLIGVVVSMTSLFAPEMAKVSMYALMALVLLVRPHEPFGRPSALG